MNFPLSLKVRVWENSYRLWTVGPNSSLPLNPSFRDMTVGRVATVMGGFPSNTFHKVATITLESVFCGADKVQVETVDMGNGLVNSFGYTLIQGIGRVVVWGPGRATGGQLHGEAII